MRKLINLLPEIVAKKQAETGMTRREIAEEAGLNEYTLSRYINDHINRFDRAILEKLCNYFEVELNEIFRLEDAS